MKAKQIMAAALLASATSWGVEVSTVTQLTNELARINSGESSETTVTLAAQTYDLSGVCMHSNANNGASALYIAKTIVLEGADATSWRMTANGDTKTVLDAGLARRVIWIEKAAKKTELKNLTIIRGGKGSPGVGVCHADSAEADRVILRNCVVRNNIAPSGTACGSAYCANAYDCRVSANTASGDTSSYANGYYVNYYDSLVENAESTKPIATGTVASNTTFRTIRATSWGTRCLEYTKVLDCVFTNGCYGCFRVLLLPNNGLVSGTTFVDLTSPTTGTHSQGSGGFPLITVEAAGLVTNCTFRNVCGNGQGLCVRGKSTARIVDCVFTNNTQNCGSVDGCPGGCVAGYSAAASDRPVVVDCTFVSNVFSKTRTPAAGCGCVIASNCTFIGNLNAWGSGGAYDSICVRCRFIGNRTTATATHEYSLGGSAGRYGEYYGCTFDDNVDIVSPNESLGDRAAGTVVCASIVSNCVFRNNRSTYNGAAVARCNLVVDSVFSNCYSGAWSSGTAYRSALNRCTFTGKSRDVLSYCGATNCLFYGLTSYDEADHTIVWRYGNVVESCTFADISDTHMKTFYLYGGTHVVKNVLFRNIGGVSAVCEGSPRIDFYNCFYDASSVPSHIVGYHDCVQSDKSPFVAADRPEYDPATPYALCRWNKTMSRGTNECFTASDVDRAGNPRLRDGQLDIGCYQCMIPAPGGVLIVR